MAYPWGQRRSLLRPAGHRKRGAGARRTCSILSVKRAKRGSGAPRFRGTSLTDVMTPGILDSKKCAAECGDREDHIPPL